MNYETESTSTLKSRWAVGLLFGALLVQFWFLNRPLSPSRSNPAIMPSRLDFLEDTHAVYIETGRLLLASEDSGRLRPLDKRELDGVVGNFGAYLLIPVLAEIFELPLPVAVEAFYSGLILMSTVLGIVGWVVYFRTTLSRLAALVFVSQFACWMIGHSDVYVAMGSAAIAFPPWILWFARREIVDARLLAFTAVMGVFLSMAQIVRSHAATPVVLMSCVALGTTSALRWRTKLGLAAVFLSGWFLPLAGVHLLENSRNSHLIAEHDWTLDEIRADPFGAGHWHSIYIGLGYLPNEYGIEYADGCGLSTAREVVGEDVVYLGNEYCNALRNEWTRIATTDPVFVASVVWAKAVEVGQFLLLFGNVGLIAMFFVRTERRHLIGLLTAIGFSSLFGLLVMPIPQYLLGMTGFAAALGAFAVGRVIEDGVVAATAHERAALTTGWRWATWGLAAIVLAVVVRETVSTGWKARTRILAARHEVLRDELDERLRDFPTDRLPLRSSLRPGPWKAVSIDVGLEWGEDGEANVRTNGTPAAYQVWGPRLKAGDKTRLLVDIDFAMIEGAIMVGVLANQSTWLSNHRFETADTGNKRFVVVADGAEDVQLVLASADADGARSRIGLRRVDVYDVSTLNDDGTLGELSTIARQDVARESLARRVSSGETEGMSLLDASGEDWLVLDGVDVEWTKAGGRLRTNDVPSTYQLMGKTVSVGADGIVLQIRLEVLDGAVSVGLLNDRQQWLFQAPFPAGRHSLIEVVDTSETSSVQLVVANARNDDGISEVEGLKIGVRAPSSPRTDRVVEAPTKELR